MSRGPCYPESGAKWRPWAATRPNTTLTGTVKKRDVYYAKLEATKAGF